MGNRSRKCKRPRTGREGNMGGSSMGATWGSKTSDKTGGLSHKGTAKSSKLGDLVTINKKMHGLGWQSRKPHVKITSRKQPNNLIYGKPPNIKNNRTWLHETVHDKCMYMILWQIWSVGAGVMRHRITEQHRIYWPAERHDTENWTIIENMTNINQPR